MYATKKVCCAIAKSTGLNWRRLKRLARYLLGKPCVVLKYLSQERKEEIVGYIDCDWVLGTF